MKFFTHVIVVFIATQSSASTQCYKFNSSPELIIKTSAADWYSGLRSAARVCFQTLTKGKYPGEQKGLDIIDICANPKKCN